MKDETHPLFDKWSFDADNREPFDEDYHEDDVVVYDNEYIREAKKYINKVLPYFDTLELNVGLLTPRTVIQLVMKYFNSLTSVNKKQQINSIEGFIRQLIGWRSYVRFIYRYHGHIMIKMNNLGLTRKVNQSWYDGNTGFHIIDSLIKKVEKYAYLHHIERLMYIGNFALLTEKNPLDIFKWFMICFIDSYEWVMVPNVMGMSQYSLQDSISMMTRPYFSSSNYIKKMSNYDVQHHIKINNKIYNWSEIWDALYYNFINKHQNILKNNYFSVMMVKRYKKMSKNDKQRYTYLSSLYLSHY